MFSGLYRVVAFAILACPFAAYPQLVSFPQPRQVSTPGGLDAVADLNGDGYSDLIGFDKSGLVLLLSNGLGGYQAPSTIPIKLPIIAVIVGDFNHDGTIDLLVSVESSGGVFDIVLLRGLGDGHFAAPVVILQGSFGSALITGDFNHDGKLDFATVGYIQRAATERVLIMLGNGDGTFQMGGATYTALMAPLHLLAGDFNGDGATDLLLLGTADGGPPYPSSEVFLSSGSGSLTSAGATPIYQPTSGIAVADVNGDGLADIVSPNIDLGAPSPYGIAVYLSKGDGTFGNAIPSDGPAQISAVAVADLNGDGIPDVAATSISESLVLFFGRVDGTFATGGDYVAGPSFTSAFILDSPSHIKAVAIPNYGSKLPVTIPISLIPVVGSRAVAPALITPGFAPTGLVTADFNGDGKLDLVTSSPTNPVILFGRGNGAFGPPRVQPGFAGYTPTLVADLNGDGYPDVIARNTSLDPQGLVFYLGNGDGTFRTVGSAPNLLIQQGSIAVADVNGDGIPDIVNVPSNPIPIQVFLGNGDGTFRAPVSTPPDCTGTIVLADFNRDRKIDMALSHGDYGCLLLGNGDGTFQQPLVLKGIEFPQAGADVNGDGIPDLIGYSTVIDGTVYLAIDLGRGDGTFEPTRFFLLPPDYDTFSALAVADWNGDGHPDIAAYGKTFTRFLLGNGAGNFLLQPNGFLLTPGYFTTAPPIIGDFNGEGKPDTAIADGVGAIWVLLNTTP